MKPTKLTGALATLVLGAALALAAETPKAVFNVGQVADLDLDLDALDTGLGEPAEETEETVEESVEETAAPVAAIDEGDSFLNDLVDLAADEAGVAAPPAPAEEPSEE